VRILHQALLGLQHIHQKGLVHRDLKPANLMLVPGAESSPESVSNATVKVLDIGLGRSLFEDAAHEAMPQLGDAHITGEGVILGTPDYMSPEQARDARAADIRSDIYSLGCVLYHLLAGQPPFPDTNIISQMIRHASEAPRPLSEFNPAVPDGLQQIVDWMLAKDPGQRYPTPERAAQALQVFLAAGSDPAAAVQQDDERLSKYLVWLEGHNSGSAAMEPAAAARAAVSAAAPASASGVMRRSSPARESRAAKKATRKVQRVPPAATPRGEEARAETAAADVELVGVAPPGLSPGRSVAMRVTRRDLLVFAAGAALGGVATLIVSLLSLGRRRDRAPDSAPAGQPQPNGPGENE